jgi:dGTPase
VQQAFPACRAGAIYETIPPDHGAGRRLIVTSSARIAEAAPKHIDDVRAPPLIRFSDEMRKDATELKRFLYANLYRHYKVGRMRVKASRIVRELFEAFMAEPACCRRITRTSRATSTRWRARSPTTSPA